MRSSKRSQAAIDFLFTYGWMIIVVIAIATGFLKFSIFDAETFAKQRCQTEVDGLICKDYLLKEDSVRIRFENYHKSTINITDIALLPQKEVVEGVVCKGSPDDSIDWIVLDEGQGANIFIEDGINGADCDLSQLDGKVNFNIYIEYYNPASGEKFKRNSTGSLLAKIE